MADKLSAVSLFTGAGGMDVGFERAGINVVFANEIMGEAAATYNANHPAGIMVNDDIENVLDQLDQFQGVDLVFGGPPCQGFSVAGKMNPDDAFFPLHIDRAILNYGNYRNKVSPETGLLRLFIFLRLGQA